MATIAVARKLAVIAWHLLTKDEDYRDARPDLVREKHRALDRMAGREVPGTRSPQRTDAVDRLAKGGVMGIVPAAQPCPTPVVP